MGVIPATNVDAARRLELGLCTLEVALELIGQCRSCAEKTVSEEFDQADAAGDANEDLDQVETAGPAYEDEEGGAT